MAAPRPTTFTPQVTQWHSLSYPRTGHPTLALAQQSSQTCSPFLHLPSEDMTHSVPLSDTAWDTQSRKMLKAGRSPAANGLQRWEKENRPIGSLSPGSPLFREASLPEVLTTPHATLGHQIHTTHLTRYRTALFPHRKFVLAKKKKTLNNKIYLL